MLRQATEGATEGALHGDGSKTLMLIFFGANDATGVKIESDRWRHEREIDRDMREVDRDVIVSLSIYDILRSKRCNWHAQYWIVCHIYYVIYVIYSVSYIVCRVCHIEYVTYWLVFDIL